MSNLIPFPKEVPMKHKKAIEALKLWREIGKKAEPVANQEVQALITVAQQMTDEALEELKAA